MKGIEGIIEKIISEAEDKAAGIIRQADLDSEKLLNDKKMQAEATAKSILAEGEKKAQTAEERAATAANMEAKKMIVLQKQELIEEAFENALDKMLALPSKEYAELISSLAAAACKDGKSAELILNAADAAKYGAEVVKSANAKLGAEKLTLAKDFANIKGGVIVRRGSIEMNCALEVIIRMLREDMAAEVADTLFSKGV